MPDQQHWHAVYTRSRHEKTVAGLLAERELECFLPLRRVLSQWKDRKKWIEKPLFPGYLFVRAEARHILAIRATKGVVRLVGPERGPPSIVSESEVANLRRLIATKIAADPYPHLKPGQLVRVARGPLRGVEGELIRKVRKYLLVISVKLFGQAVAAELSAEDVRGL